MSDLDDILNEDKQWRKEFDSMKVTGNCDNRYNCDKPATTWFGNTSRATCGSAKCISQLQYEYNQYCEQNSGCYDD